MKNIQNINILVMIIGAFSIIAGIYVATTGGEFQDYFFSIFIGFTLFGSGYFNNKAWKDKSN